MAIIDARPVYFRVQISILFRFEYRRLKRKWCRNWNSNFAPNEVQGGQFWF